MPIAATIEKLVPDGWIVIMLSDLFRLTLEGGRDGAVLAFRYPSVPPLIWKAVVPTVLH